MSVTQSELIRVRREGDRELRRNVLLTVLVAVIVPSLILMRFADERFLGPRVALIVALVFPLANGVFELRAIKKVTFIVILGFIGTLLTGLLGLLEAGPLVFAFKEALLPAAMSVAFFGSMFSRKPLIVDLVFSDKMVNVDLVEATALEKGVVAQYNQVYYHTNLFFVLSFALSAVVNFVLSIVILQSPPGTAEFVAELGRMDLIAMPVVLVPTVIISIGAFLFFYRRMAAVLGLSIEQVSFRSEKTT